MTIIETIQALNALIDQGVGSNTDVYLFGVDGDPVPAEEAFSVNGKVWLV